MVGWIRTRVGTVSHGLDSGQGTGSFSTIGADGNTVKTPKSNKFDLEDLVKDSSRLPRGPQAGFEDQSPREQEN